MVALFQKVKSATIFENSKSVGEIGDGVLIYLGIVSDDTNENQSKMIKKILETEIIPDINGRMTQNLVSSKMPVMLISQFTLCADLSGKKPSFTKAKPTSEARFFYQNFAADLKKQIPNLVIGTFGSYIQIDSVNDGPVNFILTA